MHIGPNGQRMTVAQSTRQYSHCGQSAPSAIVPLYLHQYMRKSMDLGYRLKDLNSFLFILTYKTYEDIFCSYRSVFETPMQFFDAVSNSEAWGSFSFSWHLS